MLAATALTLSNRAFLSTQVNNEEYVKKLLKGDDAPVPSGGKKEREQSSDRKKRVRNLGQRSLVKNLAGSRSMNWLKTNSLPLQVRVVNPL